MSPDLTVYVFPDAVVGVGLGVGVAVGVGVGVAEAVGVGVGLTGAGVGAGAGAATTVSETTAAPADTLDPVGTLFAKTESTGMALGPEPFRAT